MAGPEDRMDRQIRVFEKAIDTMLIDSPNFLVSNSEPTHGYYVDDHGAVFTFRTSLVSKYGGWDWWDHLWHRDDDDDHKGKKDRKKIAEKQAELYEDGKEELIETLLTFGEVLTTLGDTEWLEVKVRLRDAYYFKEHDLSRLKMKVKMSDLRAYYDGRLQEEQAAGRIEIDED
jgi:hypothetical protein